MAKLTWKERFIKATQFGASERIALYGRLGTLVSNDVGVSNAIEILHGRYLKRKDIRAGMLKSWLYGLRQGHGISVVMGNWISPAEKMMLEAAETSGKLGENLRETERMLEAVSRIKQVVKTKSATPIAVLLIVMSALVGLSINLVPVFREIGLPKESWESGVLFAEWVYNVIFQNLFIVVAGILAVIALIAWSLPNLSHPIRYRLLDRFPPYNIYRAFQGSVVMVALSTMLSAGVPIDIALKKIQDLSNRYVKVQIELVLQRLRAGSPPKEALQIDLFDDDIKDDIYVYSQFGDFDSAMKKMSRSSIARAENAVGKAVGAANKYVGMGGAFTMLWIMSSVVLTLLSMADSLSY